MNTKDYPIQTKEDARLYYEGAVFHRSCSGLIYYNDPLVGIKIETNCSGFVQVLDGKVVAAFPFEQIIVVRNGSAEYSRLDLYAKRWKNS